MNSSRTILTSVLCVMFFSSLSIAQDLGKYRNFQFGMSIESVATEIHMKASDAKTSHVRPALIQTLQWDQIGYSEPAKTVSVRSIRFDFYNTQLSRMVVTYNP